MAYVCQEFVFALNAVLADLLRNGFLGVFAVGLVDEIAIHGFTVDGAGLVVTAAVTRALRPTGHCPLARGLAGLLRSTKLWQAQMLTMRGVYEFPSPWGSLDLRLVHSGTVQLLMSDAQATLHRTLEATTEQVRRQ